MLEERNFSEEDCVKCFLCSTGLSPLEVTLHSTRCVWCGEDVAIPHFLNFALKMYYDYRIYVLSRKIKAKCHDVKYARALYLGCLGSQGYNNFVKIKTVKDRRNVLNEMRYVFKKMTKKGSEMS